MSLTSTRQDTSTNMVSAARPPLQCEHPNRRAIIYSLTTSGFFIPKSTRQMHKFHDVVQAGLVRYIGITPDNAPSSHFFDPPTEYDYDHSPQSTQCRAVGQLLTSCRVEEIAKKHGISMVQVAVAWTLLNNAVFTPIAGTTSLANLADIVCVTHVQLIEEEMMSPEELYLLTKVSKH
ncbi:hypothetical protein B0H14DRAFT_2565886 [Mycena olivaceomarginata]|nr:hypothetical protein B0H14DRAFT_2565886 [Mycena olivaceomarginata]